MRLTTGAGGPVPPPQDLPWEGMVNARDLGGLITGDGRTTRRGAVVRSDDVDHLTPSGWEALHAYGVRTVVSLTTAGIDPPETPDHPGRPGGLNLVRVDIEDGNDPEFHVACVANDLWATPLYFADAIRRWPHRCAAAVTAVAQAEPGEVLFHCGRGCDRTGLLALLILTLVGVEPAEIAADYRVSAERLRYREPGYPDWLARFMAERGTTVGRTITETVTGIDIEVVLRAGGLTTDTVDALGRRLVGPAAAG